MRHDVRALGILVKAKKITGCELKNFHALELCIPTSGLGIFTNDPRAGKLLPSGGGREQALSFNGPSLLTYCRLQESVPRVSGEGYILVTLQPIQNCNPGPYSGHEVKIIYQSYRQDVERFALLTIPWRSLNITVDIYTWIHLNNTWPIAWAVVHRSSGSPIIIPSHGCTT